MGKTNCVFHETYSEQYPFLRVGSDKSSAYCHKCRMEFSIAGHGRDEIEHHVKSKRHRDPMQASAKHREMTQHLTCKQMGPKEKLLASNEAAFAYHTVKHGSFKSMDATAALVRRFSEPQYTFTRKKSEAIVQNVLYPHVLSRILKEIASCKFVTILYDASNQQEIKTMPIMIRYFNLKQGVCVKLLQLKSLRGETAEEIASHISETINQSSLQTKVIAISADNINTSFGGSKGTAKTNVFHRLEAKLQTKLIQIGCSAHIAHNALKVAADILPVDLEIVIGKIYHYFKSYNVRVDKLKAFRIFLDIEYRRTLGYSSTRLLVLLPVINRILESFDELKSYFLSCEKPPVTLKNFFNDPTSELWLMFVQSQSHLFQTVVKRLEEEHVSIGSVAKTLDSLKCDLESRLRDKFVPCNVRRELKQLEDGGHFWKLYVNSKACEFYSTAVEYIQEWTSDFNEFKSYEWLELNQEIPAWSAIESGVTAVIKRIKDHSGIHLDDSKLYTQISEVRRFVNAAKLSEWAEASAGLGEKWIDVFDHLNKLATISDELVTFTEYLLCLPGSNSSVERVLARTFEIWRENKFQLSMQSLRAMVSVDHNFNMKCKDFYKHICKEAALLDKVHATGMHLASTSVCSQSSACNGS